MYTQFVLLPLPQDSLQRRHPGSSVGGPQPQRLYGKSYGQYLISSGYVLYTRIYIYIIDIEIPRLAGIAMQCFIDLLCSLLSKINSLLDHSNSILPQATSKRNKTNNCSTNRDFEIMLQLDS